MAKGDSTSASSSGDESSASSASASSSAEEKPAVPAESSSEVENEESSTASLPDSSSSEDVVAVHDLTDSEKDSEEPSSDDSADSSSSLSGGKTKKPIGVMAVEAGKASGSAGAGKTGFMYRAVGPLAWPMWAVLLAVGAVLLVTVVLAVVLTLPEDVTCNPDNEGYYNFLIDKAAVEKREPPLLCTYYESRDVRLVGSGYFKFEDEDFSITIDGTEAVLVGRDDYECSELDVRGNDVESCSEAVFTVPLDNVRNDSLFVSTIKVRTPRPEEDCDVETTIVRAPPPTIGDVFPPAICRGVAHEVVVSGANFLAIDGVVPHLRITNRSVAQPLASPLFGRAVVPSTLAMGGCVGFDVPQLAVQVCSNVTLNISSTDANIPLFESGLNFLEIINADPAGCIGQEPLWNSIHLVEVPTIDRTDPPFLSCADTSRTVRVFGTGFLEIDGVVPAVWVGGVPMTVSTLESCTALNATRHTMRTCTEIVVVIPAGFNDNLVEPLGTAVEVQLPFISQCAFTQLDSLVFLPRPVLDRTEPPILSCPDVTRNVSVFGSWFVEIDGMFSSVSVDSTSMTVLELKNCTTVSSAKHALRTCTEIVAEIPAYFNDVVVPSPSTVDVRLPILSYCGDAQNGSIVFLPRPVLTEVSPRALCRENSNTLEVHGFNLYQVDGTDPSVSVEGSGGTTLFSPSSVLLGGCSVVDARNVVLLSCTRMNVSVTAAESALWGQTVGSPEHVLLTTPAPLSCSNVDALDGAARFWSFAAPAVTSAVSGVVCKSNTTQTIVLEGSGFLEVNGVTPTVDLSASGFASNIATRLSNCTLVDQGNETSPILNIQSCTLLEFDLDVVVYPGQSFFSINGSVLQDNLCAAIVSEILAVVPPPDVAAVSPDIVCANDAPLISLQGSFASPSADATAQVNIFASPNATAPGVLYDQSLVTSTFSVYNKLNFSLPANGYVRDIPFEVVAACPTDPSSNLLYGVLTPQLVSISPSQICEVDSYNMQLRADRLTEADSLPAVLRLNGNPVTAISFNCANDDLNDFNGRVQLCEGLNFTYAAGATAFGLVDASVSHLGSTACSSSSSSLLEVFPDPVVANVTPGEVCFDQAYTVSVTGSKFHPSARVFFIHADNREFEMTDVASYKDSTLIEVTLAMRRLPVGVFSVRVQNLNDSSCLDTLVGQFWVQPVVLPFFVDPPVVYNAISLSVTLYSTGLVRPAKSITLTSVGQTPVTYVLDDGPLDNGTVLTYFIENDQNNQPKYNRPKFSTPIGIAQGVWSVEVVSDIGCTGLAGDVLFVQNTTTIVLESIVPGNAWTGEDTAVTVARSSGDAFEATPRIYLSPENATSSLVGQGLRGVDLVDGDTLTAVIPKGIPVGDYKVVVINPSGSVGVLEQPDGFMRIQEERVPEISNVDPTLFIGFGNEAVMTVTGKHFSDTVNAYLDCVNADGSPVNVFQPVEVAGSVGSVSVSSNTSVVVTVFANQWPNDAQAASICVIIVENNNTGAKVSFSNAQMRKNDNPDSGEDTGKTLTEARRLPAVASSRVTTSSRFLLAIGGDGGDPSSASTVVDSAALSLKGLPGDFKLQRNQLPAARTYSGAERLGQYVYLVGGISSDGNATTTIWRAQTLVPDQTPTADVSIELKSAVDGSPIPTNFTPGLWFYRVSALFDDSNVDNPNGESLPGEVLTLQLPNVTNLVLTLSWDVVPGASGYRLYRTPSANLDTTQLRKYADIIGATNVSFVDEGLSGFNNSTEVPLPVGSLGPWNEVGSLQVPRGGHGVELAPNPADESQWFLYALGGASKYSTDWESTTTSWYNTYEFATITVSAGSLPLEAEHQAVSSPADVYLLPATSAFQKAVILDSSKITNLQSRGSILLFQGLVANANTPRFYYGYVLANGTIGNATETTLNGWAVTSNGAGKKYPCYLLSATDSGPFMIEAGGSSNVADPLASNNGLTSAVRLNLLGAPANPINNDLVAPNTASAGAASPPPTHGAYMGCAFEFGTSFFVGGYAPNLTITSAVGLFRN